MCNVAFAWVLDGKTEEERDKMLADLNGATAEAEREALRLLALHQGGAG